MGPQKVGPNPHYLSLLARKLRRTNGGHGWHRLAAPPARAGSDPRRGELCGHCLAPAADCRRHLRAVGRSALGDGVADRDRRAGVPDRRHARVVLRGRRSGHRPRHGGRRAFHGRSRTAFAVMQMSRSSGRCWLAVAVLLVRQSDLGRAGSGNSTIAVLPFQNLSTGAEGEILALGIAESVLYQLAKLAELDVIARTSSFAFRDHGHGRARDRSPARRPISPRRERAERSFAHARDDAADRHGDRR